jgi:hypothetical protein|tara:strand:- start:220 stop:393 length:174 start_codon:yes stop_codon:yes gene_type:complete
MKMEESAKHALDWLSVGAAVSTLAGWLPPVASLLTIVWMSLRIWQDPLVTKWREKVK